MDPILLEKFIKAVKKYNMIQKGDKILVGFSGGPDSVFLVEILKEVRDYFGIGFSCLHVNHMLRGEESFRDEAFCKEFCSKEMMELFIERVDVRSLKREGESIEETARRLRYEKFTEYWKRVVLIKSLSLTRPQIPSRLFSSTFEGHGGDGIKRNSPCAWKNY
jgi:tRNA(Ile)-lysidine synthase